MRYFRILNTEENREMFSDLIGRIYPLVRYSYTCDSNPSLGGTYVLDTDEGCIHFNDVEVEEIRA